VPNTVVFLWISAALGLESLESRGASPAPAAAGALSDYGAARGLTFVPVAQGRPLDLPGYDGALVDRIEAELEQARTALSALEEQQAGEQLNRVREELLAHPHLPQAPFLMAECLALVAQSLRTADPAQAFALETDRAALEGSRAPAFGETTAAQPDAPSRALDVSGLGASDELTLDGVSLGISPHSVRLAPGLHHARVERGGRPIFAGFVRVDAAQTSLALKAPRLEPCSAEDLADALTANPGAIACERWAKVRSEPGGIGVALCEHDRCGSFVHWHQRRVAPFSPIAVERQRLPSWAGFALAGAGVLAASSLVLWQAGAFDRGHATSTTWEYGGLNPQAVRF
jgi:hypothetical protein